MNALALRGCLLSLRDARAGFVFTSRDFRRDILSGGGDPTICDVGSYKEIIAPHSSERTEYLSPREKQLLRRFAQGKTDERIAIEFGRTKGHIGAQRLRIMKKFRLESQAELVALADQVAWPTSRTGVCIIGLDPSAKSLERRLLK